MTKHNIEIGKYTLESLTAGMYRNPLSIYREYIQNSADGIDVAITQGLLKKDDSVIRITIDPERNNLMVEDNGAGISYKRAPKVLIDVGNSDKDPNLNRGFRGIGRLVGLSYCDELVFETSTVGERKKTVVKFDALALRSILQPNHSLGYDMLGLLEEVTQVEVLQELESTHYFRVTMKGVDAKSDILCFDKVKDYLTQVAPLPFNHDKFVCAKVIHEVMQNHNIKDPSYNIVLFEPHNSNNEHRLYKPYKTRFLVDRHRKFVDEVKEIETFIITDDYRGDKIAFVWFSKSSMLGTILDPQVKGLRLRRHGLLIGDRFTLNDVFKEDRFNGWVQGEVVVLDDSIIPNARRDDFEENDEYIFLLNSLREVVQQIHGEIRAASRLRAQKRKVFEEQSSTSQSPQAGLMVKLDKLVDSIVANQKREDLLEEIKRVINEKADQGLASLIINEIESLIMR